MEPSRRRSCACLSCAALVPLCCTLYLLYVLIPMSGSATETRACRAQENAGKNATIDVRVWAGYVPGVDQRVPGYGASPTPPHTLTHPHWRQYRYLDNKC